MRTTEQEKMYLTAEGLTKLREELSDLQTRGRRELAERIKHAKEFGDLSENAEYQEAKEQQAFVEGRIAELEDLLKRASVIQKKSGNEIDVGSTVVVQINGGEGRFTIVGSAEANPEQGLISNESPLGKALLGRKVGEQVEVHAPVGVVTYTVKKIS